LFQKVRLFVRLAVDFVVVVVVAYFAGAGRLAEQGQLEEGY
jgi:hypothetical protein